MTLKIVRLTPLLFLMRIAGYLHSFLPAFSRRSLNMVVNLPCTLHRSSSTVNDRVNRFISFLDQCPDPYHCVTFISQYLELNGFTQLQENAKWSEELNRNGKYYLVRGGSSVVAFTIGSKYEAGNGFKILGAHTDSPILKLKPYTKRSINSGVVQLNVECYGGGLWHTWFDRDLSISGRVIVKDDNGKDFIAKLIRIDRPLLRIPSLCIHLRTQEERDAFKFNKEDHLVPILCEEISKEFNKASTNSNETQSNTWMSNQSKELLGLLSHELNCSVDSIVDFDLSLYDTQKASQSGINGEFICSSRLDNLGSCFVIMESLVDHCKSNDSAIPSALEEDDGICIMALFDHEEVGSESATGAGTNLIEDSIQSITNALLSLDSHVAAPATVMDINRMARSRSIIVSADMSHAVHPNYASKHDKSHSPVMNGGVVIKSNSNQRYSTSGITSFLTRELARRADVPIQEFSVRNDCPCGSTIGPILSTRTGIRAVDVGMPQLSMHSIREMMGGTDLTHCYQLFRTLLKDFSSVDKSLKL